MQKLSTQTLKILKNFADINGNLLVKAGNVLSTISEATNICAFATIGEEFKNDFGLYDLNEFIRAYSLLEDPDLEFGKSSVILSSGKSRVEYRFADESTLTFPQKKITMPSTDLTVNISEGDLNQVRKAASALGHSIMSIRSDGSNIVLSVMDPKNTTANTYTITLDANNSSGAEFNFQFLIANIKTIPGDYDIKLSSKCISLWTNINEPIEYFVALEKTSTYNA